MKKKLSKIDIIGLTVVALSGIALIIYAPTLKEQFSNENQLHIITPTNTTHADYDIKYCDRDGNCNQSLDSVLNKSK